MTNILRKLPERISRLMVFNAKGGVGKTAISINMALTFGYGIITNDRLSVVDRVLGSKKSVILDENEPIPDIPSSLPIIFDFGGYPDRRALTALSGSNAVLIPALPYKENIQSSLDFIKEIKDFMVGKSEIIIVVNQTSGKQYEYFSEVFNRYFPNIKTFNIKRSSALSWMISRKKSVADLARENRLWTRHFQPVADQFNALAEYLIEI